MKKMALTCLNIFLIFVLCSCKIEFHWLEQGEIHRVYLPWNVGIVILVGLSLFVIIMACVIEMVYLTHRVWKCPICGAEITPCWYELSALIHQNNRCVLKCPDCHRRGFCDLIGKM